MSRPDLSASASLRKVAEFAESPEGPQKVAAGVPVPALCAERNGVVVKPQQFILLPFGTGLR